MKTWFSPHGTEWQAETYEEALEQERDALVEQLEALQKKLHHAGDMCCRPPGTCVDAEWFSPIAAQPSTPASKPLSAEDVTAIGRRQREAMDREASSPASSPPPVVRPDSERSGAAPEGNDGVAGGA
jgi:hypothetical protein